MPSHAADEPSAPRLRVLDDVTWSGQPVPGERTHALLRCLVEAGRRGASESVLVEEIWGDGVPANPTKALQVVVSRARSATGPEIVERTARGYRLALEETDVDAWALRPEGLRLAASGEYAAALPLLERAAADDVVTAALLRAVAGVHGVPAALERFQGEIGRLVVGAMAGDRQEHLVEGGLLARGAGDRQSRLAQRDEHLG